jgi:hypothetical protein
MKQRKNRPPEMRLRLYDGNDKALQELMLRTGLSATQILNQLILSAVDGTGEPKDDTTTPQ